MQARFVTIVAVIGLIIPASMAHAASATWDGSANSSWTDSANWGGLTPPGSAVSGGAKGDRATFGIRGVGANDPTHNAGDGNEVAGLVFNDEWTLHLTTDIRVRQNGRGIDVDIAGKDGTVIINGDNNDDVLWFDNPTNTIATGDTLIINTGWEALSSTPTHNFNGGGTVVFNGSFASGNKEQDIRFVVTENTTIVANTLMRLGDGNNPTAVSIGAGSKLAGTGGLQAGGAGGSRNATINGILTPGWGATPIANFNFDNVSTVNLNGEFVIDIDALGNADSLTANLLNLGVNSVIDVSGVSGAEAYIIASYTTLSGVFDESNSVIPDGYFVDYNYLGGNQIALVVPEPASLVLLGAGVALILGGKRFGGRRAVS